MRKESLNISADIGLQVKTQLQIIWSPFQLKFMSLTDYYSVTSMLQSLTR